MVTIFITTLFFIELFWLIFIIINITLFLLLLFIYFYNFHNFTNHSKASLDRETLFSMIKDLTKSIETFENPDNFPTLFGVCKNLPKYDSSLRLLLGN